MRFENDYLTSVGKGFYAFGTGRSEYGIIILNVEI
jgi:hypothetical protein